ncbi:hypothetical protein PAPYR_13191 [Paratrimastix pyriformis]|uniref:Uncharacterized protein n=1 Tax=Paratrimastix pyriformis TaxID=342808 RepID=A0ABQ8U2W7_9EUKA|nr:hypothetical protein PAPYR_13191 [Paratrimastix pyriformis]
MSTPLSVSSAADDHLLAALEKGAEKKQRTHKKAALKKPCAPGASAAEPMELDESAGSLAPAGPAPQGQAPVTGEAAGMVGSSVSGEESGAAAPAASAPASLGASASSGAVASSGPGAPPRQFGFFWFKYGPFSVPSKEALAIIAAAMPPFNEVCVNHMHTHSLYPVR